MVTQHSGIRVLLVDDHRILREVEHPLLTAALAATRGNQIRAADLLGVNRNTLRKKIRDLDIQVIRTSG